MTEWERRERTMQWGRRACPHPSFESVLRGSGNIVRACELCGATMNEIVERSSHKQSPLPPCEKLEPDVNR